MNMGNFMWILYDAQFNICLNRRCFDLPICCTLSGFPCHVCVTDWKTVGILVAEV